MDTRRMYLVKNIDDFSSGIELPDVPEEVQIFIENYVSFGEHLQDVHQLFKLLGFNLRQLFDYCVMEYRDKFVRVNGEKVDFYYINGLVINIISSAKVLVEALETFYKTELGDERKNIFKREVLSKKYDDVFSYRFLLYLRNFAQHGHLPISYSSDDDRFCFDLTQIVSTQHISANKAMIESMNKVYDQIVEKFNDVPKIAITHTLDIFTLTVYEIYWAFLKSIDADVKDMFDKQLDFLNRYPELIYKGDNALNGEVLYLVDEDKTLHTYNPKDNLFEAFIGYKKEAENVYQEYKAEHVEI